MKTIACATAFCLIATTVAAEWPATRFIPIPTTNGDSEAEIGDDMGGAGEGGWLPTISGSVMTFETLDTQQLKRGAIGALTDILNQAAIDARKLSKAGFRAPLIDPRVDVTSTGESFYGIFWENPNSWVDPSDPNFSAAVARQAPMRRGCLSHNPRMTIDIGAGRVFGIPGSRETISVNSGKLGFGYLSQKWGAGGFGRERTTAYVSATLIHEVVHAIQAAGMTANCSDAQKWLVEGTADAIAYYLLSKRGSDVFNRFDFPRNDRRWDVPLDPGGVTGSSSGGAVPTYTYATGSFFRYLLEASESGGQPDMRILRQVLGTPNAQVRSRAGVLKTIDNAIESFTGDRDLYRVFPEFLTEMASYGGSRYTSFHGGASTMSGGAAYTRSMDFKDWMNLIFKGCTEYALTPGEAIPKTLEVQQLAGKCVKVSWTGFTKPVALQLYAETTDEQQANLHLGEAYRKDGEGEWRCYDNATKGLGRRISMRMDRKCILKRGSREVKGGGGQDADTGLWTSDFSMMGDGEVYFIVTNIAKDPIQTQDVSFNLVVGSLDVKSDGPEEMQPRDTSGGSPVGGGRTDMDKRLHTMQGAGDRMLFDGRSIIGSDIGLGYLEGIGPGSTGEGVMTIVRGGNYWVMFVGVGPNHAASVNDGAMIIKNPSALEQGNPMGALFTGSVIGQGQPVECGREVMATVNLIEQTKDKLVFQIAGDLFDMRRAMMAGASNDICAALATAFVERADFTISLPYGRMYDGDSEIKRTTPPGQEVYDELEFRSGPTFGGIESSASLVSFSEEETGGPSGSSGGGDGGASGSAGGGDVRPSCVCTCPDDVTPQTAVCAAQCAPVLAVCQPASGKAKAPDAISRYEEFARLLESRGLPPDTRRILQEDFIRMTTDTQDYLLKKFAR